MAAVRGALTLLVLALAACGDESPTNQREKPVRPGASPEQVAASKALGVPLTVVHEGTGIEFVLVPGTKGLAPYYLARTEVTNRQYKLFKADHQGAFLGDNNPADMVPIADAKRFAAWLGDGYRLPTEAEWEHACRAGTTTPFAFGETLTRAQANIGSDTPTAPGGDNRTQPVGTYEPNRWGLHNMHGNLREWCLPPREDILSVSRGGSWRHPSRMARSDARSENTVVDWRDPDIGFRVLRITPSPEN